MKLKIRLIICIATMGLIGIFVMGCDMDAERKEIDLNEQISDAELLKLAPKRDANIFRFGFNIRSSPQEDARQYIPLLTYLERATGYRFELRFTPRDSNIADDIGKGIVQFAAVGAGTFIQANAKYGILPLVRGLNTMGKAEYRSVIVVSINSPIQRVDDLRGKRFAFGAHTSTQGHLIPRIILFEHGLKLGDLAGYGYTGSHLNCANAVISGRFDACGMQDTMGRELEKAGLLRILYISALFPSSGIAVHRDVPQEVREKVKKALLDFQPGGRDAEGLYHWEKTEMPGGFIEAKEDDYDELIKWAKKLNYF